MSHRTILTFVAVVLAAGAAAWADDYVGASGSNYDVGANWSAGTVPSDVSAYIRNGATVTLDSAVVSPLELWVGGPSDATGVDGSKLVILPGAQLATTTGSFVIGQQYSGEVVQSGGSIAVPYLRMSESSGGNSAYALQGGTLIMDYNLRSGASTWTMDFGRGGGTASFTQTGGYVVLNNNSYWNLGYANNADSLGEFTMTNGSVAISGQAFNIGRGETGYIGQGRFTMYGGTVVEKYKLQIGYRGTGEFNQYDGIVLCDPDNSANQPILLGEADSKGAAAGAYNLQGGSVYIGGSLGLRVGSKYDATNGTGVGVFDMVNAGLTVQSTINIGTKGGRGTFLAGSGAVVETGNLIIANAVNTISTVPSQGLFRISGGSVGVASGIIVGQNGPGRLEVASGTLASTGVLTLGGGDTTYGIGTGELMVGANAYCSADSTLTIGTSNAVIETEIASATANGKVGASDFYLGSEATLAVNTTGYRPKEADKFTVLVSTSGISGDFSTITSNITNGLPGGQAFSGAVNGNNYEVTFLGYTAGDANGDHAVDGGDLALMGGAWLQSGQTWATADFNGDGTVDGGDLALMGGNWMWSLPAAPEAPLPEPATLALLGLGGLALRRRRR